MSSLTLTLIQSNLHWQDVHANLAMFGEKIKRIKDRTEVIILPEMFSTGFTMKPELFAEKMDGETIRWMRNLSAEKRVIITGSVIIEEDGQYFNRLVWMLPNGKMGYYDKRHLFGFAGEDEHYSAGSKRFIASVNGWKINLLICYDLRFPVWCRQQMHSSNAEEITKATNGEPLEFEYDVLVFVANWPEKRNAAWKTLLQARAIENQCYTIGVNRVGYDGNETYHSGDSMVVDPMGEVLYYKAHDEDVFTTTLQKHKLDEARKKLPFLKDADPFIILK